MASKDIYNNTKVAVSFAPAVRTADANGTTVDTQGYESVVMDFQIGTEGVTLSTTDKIALEIEHSDDDSSWSDCEAGDTLGEESAGVVKTLDTGSEAPANYRVAYLGSKRYVRAVLNFSGTHGTGTPTGATVLLGNPRHAPTTQ